MKTGLKRRKVRDGQCKTKALDVKTSSKIKNVSYSMEDVTTQFNSSSIDNPRCRANLIQFNQTMVKSPPPKQLNDATSISQYKEFLNQHLNNPMLVEIIREIIRSMQKA